MSFGEEVFCYGMGVVVTGKLGSVFSSSITWVLEMKLIQLDGKRFYPLKHTSDLKK